MRPILYSFRRCPYAIRARLALRYAGIEVALREVVLADKPSELLEASPKGTVPVLIRQTPAGTLEVIDESLDIMLWALAQHDPEGWLDTDLVAASNLIDANDDQFKPWLDRYKYPGRYDDCSPDEAREQCEAFIAHLDERLRASPFLLGRRVGLADMALYSFVRQFAFVDIDRFRSSTFTSVIRWLDDFLASGLFAAVMEKYPQWRRGDAEPVF